MYNKRWPNQAYPDNILNWGPRLMPNTSWSSSEVSRAHIQIARAPIQSQERQTSTYKSTGTLEIEITMPEHRSCSIQEIRTMARAM